MKHGKWNSGLTDNKCLALSLQVRGHDHTEKALTLLLLFQHTITQFEDA